jgi:hypothetical protein
MGRGIVESGLFRAERYGLQERTSDPGSYSEGEAWIRTDVSPDTDQIATLRFADGSSTTIDVPIYDSAASAGSNLSKAWRVRVNGVAGFVPIVETGGVYDQIRMQHNGNWWGAHDSLIAIPNSEADQKLVHRWYLSEDSGPFVDEIGSADGSNNGTVQVTGDWVDGAARDGDGASDYIETTTWGSFGSNMDTDWAIAFSIQTSDSGFASILGTDANYLRVDIAGVDGGSGELTWFMRDGSGNDLHVGTDNRYDDGNPHRVVFNKTGNTASDLEIWVDGTNVSQTVYRDNSWGDVSDFSNAMPFLCRYNSGFQDFVDATLDDPCVFDKSLTKSEIESYQSPWS